MTKSGRSQDFDPDTMATHMHAWVRTLLKAQVSGHCTQTDPLGLKGWVGERPEGETIDRAPGAITDVVELGVVIMVRPPRGCLNISCLVGPSGA